MWTELWRIVRLDRICSGRGFGSAVDLDLDLDLKWIRCELDCT